MDQSAVRRTAPLIVAFALIPLLLTACGGSEPSAQPTGDGGSSTAPSEAPTASAGGDLVAIADIKLLDLALLDLNSEIRWMENPITDPEDLLGTPISSVPRPDVCPSFAGLEIAIGGPDGDVPAPKTGFVVDTYAGPFVQVPIAVSAAEFIAKVKVAADSCDGVTIDIAADVPAAGMTRMTLTFPMRSGGYAPGTDATYAEYTGLTYLSPLSDGVLVTANRFFLSDAESTAPAPDTKIYDPLYLEYIRAAGVS